MSDLPAGRALDALVAERVFGVKTFTLGEMWAEAAKVWREQPECMVFLMGFRAVRHWNGPTLEQEFRPYSTDIAAAWEVVEKMRSEDWWFNAIQDSGTSWQAEFWCSDNSKREYDYASRWGHGETAPHAICLAALAACLDPTHEPEAPSNEGKT